MQDKPDNISEATWIEAIKAETEQIKAQYKFKQEELSYRDSRAIGICLTIVALSFLLSLTYCGTHRSVLRGDSKEHMATAN